MPVAALHRLAAFTRDPNGGNPAGVWVGDEMPNVPEMQRTAAEVGFSETAFIAPNSGTHRTVRYFSPVAEVSFCGHATIASGIVLAESDGDGTFYLASQVGEVRVAVTTSDGVRKASLTSVTPRHELASEALLADVLRSLHWERDDLDFSIPPARAFAGAWHLILATNTLQRLSSLDYDFASLKALMLQSELTTVQLVHRTAEQKFQSRNPFPVGGVVEDPATGASAAALGGYLRDANLIAPPITIEIVQGEVMGRPSYLTVDIPVTGGIVVTGTAVRIADTQSLS